MIQNNNSTNVSQSQHITRWGDARELTPEERLSSIDLENLDFGEVIDRILATNEIREEIGEEYLDDYKQVLLEDVRLGSRSFLDFVNWYNSKCPNTPILIPSDYGINTAEVELPDWLISGLVLRNGLTLFYGDAGSYKTTLTIYMGYALMTGTEFFGIPIDGSHKVLYVEQDESINILKDQVQKIGFPEDMFVCCKLPVLWNGKNFNQEFFHSLEALKPDVVFIDSLTNLGIEDIAKPPAILCVDALRRIANTKKLSFVLLHHENLQGKPLGLRLIIGRIDSEIQTSVSSVGNEDKITLVQGKVRGQHLEPMFFKANRGTLQIERELNMTIARRVQQMAEQGLDRTAILGHFKGTQEKAAARKAYQRLTRRTQVGTSNGT
jgi:hypothetical protein